MNKIFLFASILLVLTLLSSPTNASGRTCIKGDDAIRANDIAQYFNAGVRDKIFFFLFHSIQIKL